MSTSQPTDTFIEALPVPKPVNQRGNALRKNSSVYRNDTDHHHFNEIEVMKRDIADKNQQIAHYNKHVEQYQHMTESLFQLILDLEHSASLSFFNPEQRQLNANTSTHELVYITRKALTDLIKIHKEMPSRFEADFSAKATEMVDSINQRSKEIEKVIKETDQVNLDIKKLERLAEIQEAETQSLRQISDTLEQQKLKIDSSHMIETTNLQDQIQTLRTSVKGLKQIAKSKSDKNKKVEKIANLPLKKRTVDSIKEDVEIHDEIENLQKRINRELQEHDTTSAELEMTKVDIERAKEVIEKFKRSLTKEQKDSADRINNQLKVMIEQQRDDYKRAMRNQRRANAELEKQKADLVEEERMLRNYLQSLEKQLQIQMQKLPSLAVLQHRFEPTIPQKKGIVTKSKQRAPDDAEMRTIKKAIFRMQNKKIVSRSVLVGKNLR